MYVVGIDGGGTKTTAALADEKGNIVRTAIGGPSNPRNVGLEKCKEEISRLFFELKGEEKISATFVALAAIQEEYASKKNEIASALKTEGALSIGSDQLAAFRCGTAEKNGVSVISGTGSAVHGWKNGEEAISGGWGYLADEGSAFYAGIKGFRAISKNIDGRGEKTALTDIVFREWGISSSNELRKKIYSDFKKFIPQISAFMGEAEKEGDEVSLKIFKECGEEIALSVRTVTNKLSFKEEKFPVVFCGAMFRSKELKETAEKNILLSAPQAEIIIPKADPVQGAVNLALELLEI